MKLLVVRKKSSSADSLELQRVDSQSIKVDEWTYGNSSNAIDKKNETVTTLMDLPTEYKIHYNEIGKRLIDITTTNNIKFKEELQTLAYVINIDSIPILILGETGVGKSFLAKKIFELSRRKNSKKFLDLDCSKISDELLTSELFGYEKGSHSTAFNTQIGKIEAYNRGTIFLDEIDKANKKSREKLLKFLDTKTFYRNGGNDEIPADVKFIFGSNKDLPWLTEIGEFEREFYERIAGYVFKIPPLRERVEDIKRLIEYKCLKISEEINKQIKDEFNKETNIRFKLDDDSIQYLTKYSWPGNIRELFKYLSWLHIKCLPKCTFTITKNLILEYPPGNKFNNAKKSILNMELELKEMFLNWYQTDYLNNDEKLSGDVAKSKIKEGFLQEIVGPILANIYESTHMNGTQTYQKTEE